MKKKKTRHINHVISRGVEKVSKETRVNVTSMIDPSWMEVLANAGAYRRKHALKFGFMEGR